jgi:hypothetical protein
MSTWEERMAARARKRRRARGELDWGHKEDHPELVAQARAQYVADHPGSDSPTPPSPKPDDYCRECVDWLPIGNWPDVYVWRITCREWGGGCRLEHAHHKTEVWLA